MLVNSLETGKGLKAIAKKPYTSAKFMCSPSKCYCDSGENR
jgi:hypothetical protein